jgi:RNA polymerase sigma-70 factor (ECF subfamily)
LEERDRLARFEAAILPHLDAAHNFARWLLRDDTDAQDVVQETYLRAFRFFGGFRGGDGRAWLLSIVRNTCYTWLQQNRSPQLSSSIEDDAVEMPSGAPDPETALLQQLDAARLRQAVEELPIEFREVLILREMEGLSYREIAELAGLPMGTVMSRLARARRRLQQTLTGRLNVEV